MRAHVVAIAAVVALQVQATGVCGRLTAAREGTALARDRLTEINGRQETTIDFPHEVRYFGGVPAGFPWPDRKLLDDPVNNRILNMALCGLTQARLEEAGFADAGARLASLVKGQCLARDGETYRVAFPVIAGESREEVDRIVERAVAPLVPRVATMVRHLAQAASSRPDALFHVLWSRAMDKFWWPAWKSVSPRSTRGAPAAAWVLHSDHQYQVGTNYHDLPGNGEIAVTWSSASAKHIPAVMSARADLARLAWGMPPLVPENVSVLQAAGCVDAGGKVRAFVLHAGDAVDDAANDVMKEYARLAAKLYDYEALGTRFHVAPGQLFAILQHETAYALYDALIDQGILAFPSALRREGEPEACAQLVSLRLSKKPAGR
jgi:hypothetical protein